jgi:protein-disulfide isomerase
VVKATPTKSRTPFIGLIALVVVAGAAGIWYSMNANKQAPIVLDPAKLAGLPPAEGYLRGDPNAPVTIMEFGDFECPTCASFATISEPDMRERIIDKGLANFRYFDFPLTNIHPNSLAASLAASCAADQGKFWEMHDAIYNAQDQWHAQATSNPRKVLDELAKQTGVDMAVYGQCYDTQKNLGRIQANKKAGDDRGVGGTPTIFIGNIQLPNGTSVDRMKQIVDSLAALAPSKPVPTDTSKKTPVAR